MEPLLDKSAPDVADDSELLTVRKGDIIRAVREALMEYFEFLTVEDAVFPPSEADAVGWSVVRLLERCDKQGGRLIARMPQSR